MFSLSLESGSSSKASLSKMATFHHVTAFCEVFGGFLGECVGGYLDVLLNAFLQDPVMPSQEPPSDAKSEEVDVPPEDSDGSKTFFSCSFFFLTK